MSLCETCHHCRVITTPKGSRFLMCQLAQDDRRYPKYPPQPVQQCAGYTNRPKESPTPSTLTPDA